MRGFFQAGGGKLKKRSLFYGELKTASPFKDSRARGTSARWPSPRNSSSRETIVSKGKVPI